MHMLYVLTISSLMHMYYIRFSSLNVIITFHFMHSCNINLNYLVIFILRLYNINIKYEIPHFINYVFNRCYILLLFDSKYLSTYCSYLQITIYTYVTIYLKFQGINAFYGTLYRMSVYLKSYSRGFNVRSPLHLVTGWWCENLSILESSLRAGPLRS